MCRLHALESLMRIFIYINNAMINLQFLSRSRTWNHMFACETRLKHVDALLFVLERSRLCNQLNDEEIVIKIYSKIIWGSELECHCLLRFEFPGNFSRTYISTITHQLAHRCVIVCNFSLANEIFHCFALITESITHNLTVDDFSAISRSLSGDL